MGTKLNILIIFLLVFLSCAIKKNDTHIGSTEEQYVRAFKKSVLMGCLNEITNNEFGQILIRKHNDIGLYTETAILFHGGVKFATNKGSNFAKELDAVNYPDVEDRMQGYSSCVDYAFYNEEIDSIARAKYKELKNGEMKYIYEEAND